MLCPIHSSTEFPKEVAQSEKQRKKRSRAREEPQVPSISKAGQAMSQMWAWPSGSPCKWVLCCSALTTMEKEIISEFTKLTNVSISKTWSPAVTHVIASTDANGACKRTLKFLMGILDGKWILSIEWVKACMKAMGPIGEEKFEITVDVHGISGGPRSGRMRAINKEPKLFSNLRFYLSGGFMPAYKGYLQDLIASAGGTILQRKPLTRDQEKLIDNSTTLVTLIIYSLEVPEKLKASDAVFECRLAEAQALADACGAKVAANSWIIESIAASKLQPLSC
ncbi:protein BREAST CANCER SUSCEPTIBILITY 1-like protein [Iris pallida]|uniref:Protein BREAST CANCER SUSCEPTIBILITY 1-like protein n=1 Tax=Iris pallida TaxID=29817 RepID=A0AAX6HHH6_IRIPA|nr:protein BREAST CANCER SUSCEPTIBILITY 1-like protein [Iris pallida]